MSYEDSLARINAFKSSSSMVEEETPSTFSLDKGVTLKKDDLKKNYEYTTAIRDYMVERKGVDYQEIDSDTLVEDFVDHMRYFNANTVSTAGEARFIGKANETRKAKASKAYQLYDQLGNVFVNDGLMGAVDGVKDYIFAAASDPTNYIGIATGGIARAGAAGLSVTGKQIVRDSVRKAGMEAAQSGLGRAAAKKAGEKAGVEAARRAVEKGMSARMANKAYDEVAKRVAKEGRVGLAKDAMLNKQKELFEAGSKRALKQTVALDASAAVLQDVMAQNVMLEAGAQTDYSVMQTGFASLLGGVAGAAQLGFGKFRGASGLEDTRSSLEKISNAVIEEAAPTLNKEQTEKATRAIMDSVSSWNAKVNRGGAFSADAMPAQLIKDIMLGEDGKGGLVKVFKDSGYSIDRNKTISDVITNVVRFIPKKELDEINKNMLKYSGIQFGELAGSKIKLGDMLAKRINEAGKTLNVMSQVRKTLDAGIVASKDKIDQTVADIDANEAVGKELRAMKKSDKFKYGQSIWKRLLVSSPATTALNIAGFGQYYAGQTMADLFNSSTLALKGLGQMAYNPKASEETFRQARALTAIQGQKIRNLLDPFTTHDEYMSFLDKNSDIQKILFETLSGGVEGTSKRYGIDPNSKVFQNIEALTTAANQITGVRIQDSFTKSQMFMTELDKYLRVKKGVTLKEALTSDSLAIDEDVLGAALDGTLRSVFSKDYTKNQAGVGRELLETTAKLVEGFSNTPVIGTVLPFGRFFNNVLATAYQWSPLAAPEQLGKFMKRTIKKEGTDITEREAFARMTVGTAAIYAAADFDTERRKKGLAYNEIEVGGGTIVDARNTFPFSMFLASGRIFNMWRNGEEIPAELRQEMLTQVGVGQLARDVQFGNDLNNILDVMLNSDEGARGASGEAGYKVAGNLVSGLTRPLDAFNKIIGFAMGTDTAKDVRQAEGINVFTQSATKYVDNILEAFIDKTDSITGEELRVATREGEIYDANPFARIFGITVKQGRTATEKAYSMSEMFPWQASERSKLPAYDKALNSMLAPALERKTQQLINSPQFKSADLTGRRRMLKQVMKTAKKEITEMMEEGYGGATTMRLRLATKANRAGGTKEIRRKAAKIMKEQHGVTGSIEDYSFAEIDLFIEYAEYLKEIYDESAKLVY
jgi:hypothetical protein